MLRIQSAPEDREWLEYLLFYMMEQEDFNYCFVFHNIDIVAVREPFAISGNLPVPAAVTLNEATDRLMLLIYFPIVSRLPFLARVELLKHEALHIIEGHFSTYGARLLETYGPQVSNVAMDCYVNQRINEQLLTDAGLPGVTVQQLGLPPNLSSEEYCKILQNSLSETGSQPLKDKLPPMPKAADQNSPKDPQAGTAGDADDGDADQQGKSGKSDGNDFTGKGQLRASEYFDKLDAKTAPVVDQQVQTLNQTIEQEFGADALKQRGWHGADYDEFITASTRPSTVPWWYYLRAKETRDRSEVIVPTRRRLSRRSPFHFGCVRKYGLDVVFVIDTSGSMGKDQLKLVEPELRGMHARGAHITVIHCDAHVARIEPYNPYAPIERFYGRGGTDFSPALFEVRKLYPRPGLFVCFTDGYGGIEAYTAKVIEERGRAWYDAFLSHTPQESPDGIDSLWLIPQGCMSLAEFASSIVPWGTKLEVPVEQ